MDDNPSAVPQDPGLDSLDGAATSEGRGAPASRLRDALAPGALLAGRYRIERFLARGGMGEVHAAHDQLLDVALALKTLRLDLEGDPIRLKRFKSELLLARSITHPNLCRAYDLAVDRSKSRVIFFLTMELLRGETLRARILARGRMSTHEALPLVREMATALAAVHAAGIVHGDFKSGNVMLVPGSGGTERVVVTDFGLAHATSVVEANAGSVLTEMDSFVGTPAYMAPEQIQGERAGPAADLYALGVVLFEMVTGSLPFPDATSVGMASQRLTGAPPSARALAPELDERWEQAILRCLAREPRERFRHAEDVVAALAGEAAAGASSRHVLPVERDAFIGRVEALEELEGSLDRGVRLVTLVGTGGAGKTRLAIRHAWRVRRSFPGGVWFCDLSEARSLDGLASVVAITLGASPGEVDSIVQLGHAIASRGRALFILDNFEQVVVHAAATVGRWLERAPEARFVVTSRERLSVPGEVVQVVETLDEEEGAQLFLARARAHRPNLGTQAGDGDEVRQIVRLVEGLPLAIELAAARVRMMSIGQIVERLRDRFRLLTGANVAGRHATLRAAIDSSWELLGPSERAAFAQCSVFEGGFTLEAAEAVLDLSSWPEAPWIVDVVQALSDKCLLRAWGSEGRGGEPRFTMYASLHEYATEKLFTENVLPGGAHAERAAMERHGRYYESLGTNDAPDALELCNFVAACRRAVARGDGSAATRTLGRAVNVIGLRGPVALGVELGRLVLGLATLGPEDRCRASCLLARALMDVGRWNEAQQLLEQGRSVALEAGDRRLEAVVLSLLGVSCRHQGRMDEARERHESALAIHRDMGNRHHEASVLGNLGNLHHCEGRLDEAREHLERALAIHREMGSRRDEAVAQSNLGIAHHNQGSIEEALRHYGESLAIARDVGDRKTEGLVLGALGLLHQSQGRKEEALASYEAARAIAREVGNRLQEGVILGHVGTLHDEHDRMDEALCCYAEALAIAREVGNRRNEGQVLGIMGALCARRGRLEDAREALVAGEAHLRATPSRVALASLLCRRGECERLAGDFPAAVKYLSEAEAVAEELSAAPGSALRKEIATLRASLGASPEPPHDGVLPTEA